MKEKLKNIKTKYMRKSIKTFLFILGICLVHSCSKEDIEPKPPEPDPVTNSKPQINLLNPSNGLILEAGTSSITFTWKGTDDDTEDVLTYDLYVGATLPSVPTASDLTESSYDFNDLNDGTSYQWKVIVNDGTDTTESDVQTFSVKTPDIQGVILEWQDVSASAYDLYFGEDSANEKVLSNTTQRKHIFSGLEVGKLYYYKLVAKGSNHEFTEHFFVYQEEGVKIFDGNVYLRSQESIREFGIQNFNEITGYLEIKQNSYRNITELGWLKSLNRLGSLYISYIDNVTSLYGLHNIDVITGTVRISHTSDLSTIELDKLLFIGGSLILYGNAKLSSLSMNRLQTIYNDIKLGGSVTFFLNEKYNFTSVTNSGDGNPLLSNISCDRLNRVLGNIWIYKNESLEHLDFLEKLEGCYKDMIIWNNDSLTSIKGLSNFSAIAQSFALVGNDALESTEGLENITIIAIETLIYDNTQLKNINLSELKKASQVHIAHNSELENLSNLTSLREIAGTFSIYENAKLSDFCGIRPLYLYGQVKGETYITNNEYNPSINQIYNGYCY